MKTLIPAAAFAAAALFAPLAAQAQTSQTYNGNGATGFGGTLGNGSLTVTSTQSSATAGNITFTFNPSGGFTSNSVIIYIDSVAGGIANTSNLSDIADSGRQGISGEQPGGNSNYDGGNASRTVVNFAPNFGADYAISFENTGFNGVFGLPTDTSSLNYITGQNANTGTSGADSVTVTDAQLGLTPGQSFNFVGTLLNASSAYRSNETIGTSTTTVGDYGGSGNAGYTGTQTFSSFDTFGGTPSAAPEPSGTAILLITGLVLGGLVIARRRRTASDAE